MPSSALLRCFQTAVPILDCYHLSANVHVAAEVVFGEATEESKQWAEARLNELWEGGHRAARRAVAELGKQRRGAKREALRKLGGYLKNNAERMDYPRYRREGLPVGSGAVESMCKTLVGGANKRGCETGSAAERKRCCVFAPPSSTATSALCGMPASARFPNPPRILSRTH